MTEPYVPNNPAARAELLKEVAHLPMHAGVTVQYPGGIRMRLAMAGGFNLRWKPAFLTEIEPYTMAIQALGEEVSDDLAFGILARAYARAVVLELEGPDTPDVSDTAALAAWLLADPDRFADIRAIAEDPENFPSAGLKETRVYGDPEGLRPPD